MKLQTESARVCRTGDNPDRAPSMRAIFFIDDWMLDERHGFDRQFPAPKPAGLSGVEEMGVSTIIHDPERKCFRAWAKRLDKTAAWLYESEDGQHWRRTRHRRKLHLRQNFSEQTWFHDPWELSPEHRHKMVVFPYEKNTYGGPGLIETSPDGVKWTLQRDWKWSPPDGNGSDTANNLFYNPFLKEYAVVCRKYHIDRRIAMVTSPDLRHWSRPVMLLQPDPMDPPLTQFYGMGVFLYRNEIFIGFPQFHRVPSDEMKTLQNHFYKMSGTVYCELAYSYDGHGWNRTTRLPVIPPGEPGEYGGGCIQTRAMVQRPDDGCILVYSRGTLTLHDRGRDSNGNLPELPARYHGADRGLMLHTWRADGFACLESFSNKAMIRTRCLVPHDPDLTLNIQIPFGEARVQIHDETGQPINGFLFEDCVPIKGDGIRMPVRWRRRKSLKAAMTGKRISLAIRMTSGRLYAINLHCSPWYTSTVHPIPRP